MRNGWQGAVTDHSFKVNARATSVASVRLLVADNANLVNPLLFGPVAPDAQDVVEIAAVGLQPKTRYWWALEFDGVLATVLRGQTRTAAIPGQPESLIFGAGACAGDAGASYRWGADSSQSPVFEDLAAQDLDFFIHTGDISYLNNTSASVTPYRGMYDEVLTAPRQSALYHSTPVVYVWDDHDYSANNTDSTFVGKTQAAQVYRERVPHHPLAESRAIYHSFTRGRVLFIVTDTRYYRSPSSTPDGSTKTMLGATQKAWFKNLLATSDAALLVWICASPWLDVRDDTWAAYPTERDELRDAFIQYGWMNRMCQVSGDYHAMAMDTGVGNRLVTGASFPMYIFSSLDSNTLQAKLGMYDVGLEQGSYHYGTVRIDDDGSAVRVTATGHNRQGVWNVHEWQPPYEPAMSEPAPSARLYRSTNQVGVPNATDTPVSWNAEEFDSHGGHAPSANPTRYTALVPGQYLCIPRLHFAGAAGGSRRVWLRVNGKTAVRGSRNVEIPTGAGLSWPAQTSALVSLSAGHYVEVMAYQSSGAPLDLVGSAAASSSQCTFDIVYVRPLI